MSDKTRNISGTDNCCGSAHDEDCGLGCIEIGQEFSIDILEIPRSCGLGPQEFFKSTSIVDSVDIFKPYPNEHACPHSSAGRFDQFRRGSRSHNGKTYGVIYGRVSGTNKWEEASYRYPKSEWSADEARSHCRSHSGMAFEAAKKSVDEISDSPNKGSTIDVKKKDDARHLVYGIVLEPDVPDLQGDFENAEEIEKSAHRYLSRMWLEKTPEMVGAEHAYPVEKAIPVESFIAPCDFWYDGSPQDDEHKVRKGSWVVVSHIADDEEFKNIKMGIYRGYSMQGVGNRRKVS